MRIFLLTKIYSWKHSQQHDTNTSYLDYNSVCPQTRRHLQLNYSSGTQQQQAQIFTTSGFLPRVRAPGLRASVFIGSLCAKRGAMHPPPLHPTHQKINKNGWTQAARVKGFPKTKCFPSGSNLGRSRHGLNSPLDHRGYEIWYASPPPPPRPSQLRWSFRHYYIYYDEWIMKEMKYEWL